MSSLASTFVDMIRTYNVNKPVAEMLLENFASEEDEASAQQV